MYNKHKIWCNDLTELNYALQFLTEQNIEYIRAIELNKPYINLPVGLYINDNKLTYNDNKDLYDNYYVDYEVLNIPKPTRQFTLIITNCKMCPYMEAPLCSILNLMVDENSIPEWCPYLTEKSCATCAYGEDTNNVVGNCMDCYLNENNQPTGWKDKKIYGKIKADWVKEEK